MKYIDLSHSLSSNTATYPSDPDLDIIKEKEIINDNSLLHSFKMGTHTGTHLDVPAHIIPGGKTLNMFSLEHLWIYFESFKGQIRTILIQKLRICSW